MFKAFSSIFTFIASMINALTAMTESVDNITASVNHCTHALRVNAESLDADSIFECKKKADLRAKKLADYKAELATE